VTPFNINLSNGHSGDWLMPFICIYGFVWLFVLAFLLLRQDLDLITKLTWVVVVVFVPFFGILLYWSIGPSSSWSPKARIEPSDQRAGTPWENDPGFRSKK
jgi:hypothetical protein